MNAKSTTPNPNWIDPDDAPELNKAWFKAATPMIGQKQVTRQEWIASVEAKNVADLLDPSRRMQNK